MSIRSSCELITLNSFFNLPRVTEISKDTITRNTIALIGSKVVTRSLHSSKGMPKAADIIRKGSQELSGYLHEVKEDIHYANIVDVGNYGRGELGEVVRSIIEREAIPFIIGGDHATTYFALKETEIPSILWLDAHTDLAEADELPKAEAISHGSALRYLVEQGKEAVVVGFRGYSSVKGELKRAKKLGVRVSSYSEWEEVLPKFLGETSAVSLDLDFFSPSIFPAVRNPEILGASIDDFVNVLRGLDHFTPRYCDVVEYLPSRDPGGYAIVLSQIILEMLGVLLATSSAPS